MLQPSLNTLTALRVVLRHALTVGVHEHANERSCGLLHEQQTKASFGWVDQRLYGWEAINKRRESCGTPPRRAVSRTHVRPARSALSKALLAKKFRLLS